MSKTCKSKAAAKGLKGNAVSNMLHLLIIYGYIKLTGIQCIYIYVIYLYLHYYNLRLLSSLRYTSNNKIQNI
jgi:hypothetical protein